MQLEGLVSELQESSCLYFPALGLQTNSCLHAWLCFFFSWILKIRLTALRLPGRCFTSWADSWLVMLLLYRNRSIIISRMILCFAKYMMYWLTPRITSNGLRPLGQRPTLAAACGERMLGSPRAFKWKVTRMVMKKKRWQRARPERKRGVPTIQSLKASLSCLGIPL